MCCFSLVRLRRLAVAVVHEEADGGEPPVPADPPSDEQEHTGVQDAAHVVVLDEEDHTEYDDGADETEHRRRRLLEQEPTENTVHDFLRLLKRTALSS